MSRQSFSILLSSGLLIISSGAYAQDSVDTDDQKVLEQVTVSGSYFRDAVLSNMQPEIRLTSEDIRAYGVNSIEDLLEELGPEISSSRGRSGGRPILLIDGVRVAGGFRELHRFPPEAIERVDVLPEEAALKLGYGADQRVLNFVLKPEFSAYTQEFEIGGPEDGAGFETEIEGNYLKIFDGKRLSLDGEINTVDGILESDRGLRETDEEGEYSLSSSSRSLELGASYHQPFDNGVRMTLNGDATFTETERLNGLSEVSFVLPANSPFSTSGREEIFTRYVGAPGSLESETNSDEMNVNLTLVKEFSDWMVTSNTSLGRSTSDGVSDQTPDSSNYQAALDALSVGPEADLSPYLAYRTQETSRVSNTASTSLLLNGRLFGLPAGDVSTGLNFELAHTDRQSETRLDGELTMSDLDRQTAQIRGSFDIPLIEEEMSVPGIDRLGANISANATEYSDFGSLFGFDGTLNWAPAKRVNLIASYTFEEGAPSMSQLGDTLSTELNTEVYDYVLGESVTATQISGGNADLQSDERHVMKLSADIEPLKSEKLNLRFSYIDTRIDNPIGSFSSIDAELQNAFPDRFVRDADGNLIAYDVRPVNFVEETSKIFETRLFWRKTFKKATQSRPQARGNGDGAPPASARKGPPSGGPPRGGPPGGGRGDEGVRVRMSLSHSWYLENERVLSADLPVQDFLNGSASGGTGGQSEHTLQLRGGVSNKAFGSRFSVEWQSGTEVLSGDSGEVLSFSDLTSVDLDLYHTLRASNPLVQQWGWLDGARISLDVENVFDEVITVSDGNGETPLRYAANRLDPEGRKFYISFRKQF